MEFRVNLGYPELLQELADGLIGEHSDSTQKDCSGLDPTVIETSAFAAFSQDFQDPVIFYNGHRILLLEKEIEQIRIPNSFNAVIKSYR